MLICSLTILVLFVFNLLQHKNNFHPFFNPECKCKFHKRWGSLDCMDSIFLSFSFFVSWCHRYQLVNRVFSLLFGFILVLFFLSLNSFFDMSTTICFTFLFCSSFNFFAMDVMDLILKSRLFQAVLWQLSQLSNMDPSDDMFEIILDRFSINADVLDLDLFLK